MIQIKVAGTMALIETFKALNTSESVVRIIAEQILLSNIMEFQPKMGTAETTAV